MKRWIAILALVQVSALIFFNASSANTANLDTCSINTAAQMSETELIKRFNDILDEELSGTNVCVTISAARQLSDLTRSGAAEVVKEKAFDRIPEAEKGMRKFAKELLANGTKESDRIRIRPETINSIMDIPRTSATAICPLFPICK